PRYSRWAVWERSVLAHVGEASECLKLIQDRRAEGGGGQEGKEMGRPEIAEGLKRRGGNPDREGDFIPNADVTEIVSQATGEKRARNKVSAYLGTLNIRELKKSKQGKGAGRGWCWRGRNAEDSTCAVEVNPARHFGGR